MNDGDEERAFQHWLQTGDIPDWRRRQLEDKAIRITLAELRRSLPVEQTPHQDEP